MQWQEGLGPHPCFRVILCSDVASEAGSSHQNRCLARSDGISTVVRSSLACLAKCQEGGELWESRQGARRAQRAPRQTEPNTRSCCQVLPAPASTDLPCGKLAAEAGISQSPELVPVVHWGPVCAGTCGDGCSVVSARAAPG